MLGHLRINGTFPDFRTGLAVGGYGDLRMLTCPVEWRNRQTRIEHLVAGGGDRIRLVSAFMS
jgi:hypothetical protein